MFAGLTVGVVALPLAMAFAIACNVDPGKGLVTAIIGGFLISFFSGSNVQIGGPTGAFVVIILGVVAQYGLSGLVISTVLAGIFLILFGLFKMGGLIRFIPFPVTTGFTSGIAVVIFSTQIKDLLGLGIPEGITIPADFVGKWLCYFEYIGTINPHALGVSAGTILVILVCRHWFPKVPGMLAGMLVATVLVKAMGLPVDTIGDKFGALPSSLPVPGLPDFQWGEVKALLTPAFTIALLAAVESLLSATVADGMTGKKHKPNVELIAQGIGNIGSAFFGGIPATGAIARTATNVKAGGKTPVSGLVHALTLLVILLVFGQYATMVPLAALGGILVVVCYNMAELPMFARLLKGPRSDAFVLVLTFVLTVMVDLIVAVEVGVVLAALLFIGRMSAISDVSKITDDITGEGGDIDESRSIEKRAVPAGVEVYEVQGPFFFGAVDRFKERILKGMEDNKAQVLILRMRQVPALDATGLNVLRGLLNHCRKNDIRLMMSGVQSQPLQVFRTSGFIHEIHKINICTDVDAALFKAGRYLTRLQEKV